MISSVVWNEEEIVKNIPKVITSPNMSLKILKDCLKKWIRVKIEEFILFVGFLKKLGTCWKHNSRSSQLKRHNQHFMINFEYYAATFPFFKGFFALVNHCDDYQKLKSTTIAVLIWNDRTLWFICFPFSETCK